MLKYTENDILEILESILDEKVLEIKNVGELDIRRHLVYRVQLEDRFLIFKMYYKALNGKCEIKALQLMEKHNIRAPKIYDYGVLDNGVDWILIEYKTGITLDDIWDELSAEELFDIFYEMGRELGKIHSIAVTEKYCSWDYNRKEILEFDSYYDGFEYNIINHVQKMNPQEHERQDLIYKAIKKLQSDYPTLEDMEELSITHNDYNARNIIVIKDSSGQWKFNCVIDFEKCLTGNSDEDLAELYKEYFLENKKLENAFLKGYSQYINLTEDFYKKLDIYILYLALNVCSWAKKWAPNYYEKNIEILEKILSKEE